MNWSRRSNARRRCRFIGNYARSGTTILEELGAEHVRTGNPILYTSADSVLQIAAHEEVVPLERLYEICRVARRHADRFRIGRVIARPFVGVAGNFRRTAAGTIFRCRRRGRSWMQFASMDWPSSASEKSATSSPVEGITESFPTESNAEGMAQIDELWSATEDGLIFANLVDFDMLYGHRRDVAGYAEALREIR